VQFVLEIAVFMFQHFQCSEASAIGWFGTDYTTVSYKKKYYFYQKRKKKTRKNTIFSTPTIINTSPNLTKFN
jgi:hypothetical protein